MLLTGVLREEQQRQAAVELVMQQAAMHWCPIRQNT
jgi:hypothetical protein